MKLASFFKVLVFSLAAVPWFSNSRAFAISGPSLTIAIGNEIDTLNPIVGQALVDIFVYEMGLRYPIILDENGKEKAVLIKEIPSFSNHKLSYTQVGPKKGLKVELEFLDKLTWGDGVPVTCNDYKTTWTIGLSPNVTVPSRDMFTDISSIDVDPMNPKKCTVTFNKVIWNYYLDFSYLIPAHIEGPIFEKFKNKAMGYEQNSEYVTHPTNPGLWCAAYRVSEFKNGSHVTLVPNEHFYGPSPSLGKITLKYITNSTSLEANLLSGAIDMISAFSLTSDQAFAFEKKIKEKNLPYQVHSKPNFTFAFVETNLNHPALKDLRVRKALMLSINRKELNDAFFEGKMTVADSFAHPLDNFFTNDPQKISIYPYDRKRAASLLEEAGWKLGSDGYRTKNGKRLMLRLTAATEMKINEQIEVYLKDAWKQIGIEIQIKNLPGRILYSETLEHHDFDLAYYSMTGSPNDAHRSMYHSSMIPTEANSYSGQNTSGWSNPEVDKLMDSEQSEFEVKKRIELVQKILKLYTEDLPTLPLYHRLVHSVTPKSLKGYDLSSTQFTEFNRVEKWSITP